MKTTKLNLKALKKGLTRDEMKKIMAGSGCGFSCFDGSICMVNGGGYSGTCICTNGQRC